MANQTADFPIANSMPACHTMSVLDEAQRHVWLVRREGLLNELRAIETLLGMPWSVLPKRKRESA